jgi:hypothetical protein
MLDILKNYLDDAAPHMTSLIKDAFAVFERAELPNYEDGFVEMLMVGDNADITTTVDKIVHHVLELQNEILQQHEVRLIDSATMATHTLFITALLDIEKYGDIAMLYKTACLNNHPNEVFAEIVALVSHKSADELLPEIESVSMALIGKIKDMCESVPEPLSEAEAYVRQHYIDNLNKFLDFIGTRELFIVEVIVAGVDPGYTFLTYLNFIGKDLENKTNEKAAHELIAAAIISEDGCHNPSNIIQKNIENYISDLDRITRINIIITDLLLKLKLD